MTAHYIATIIEKKFNEIDISNPTPKTLERYNIACSLMERFCGCGWGKPNYMFLKFEETELVYKYAKDICEQRNAFLNWYRAFGYYDTIEIALKKYFK